MKIKPIDTIEDYESALIVVERFMDNQSGLSDDERDDMEVLSILIEKYEDIQYPISKSDPIAVIEYAMNQRGLVRSDLYDIFGSSGRTSEIFNKKRNLSIEMVKKLHKKLNIPYELLIEESEVVAA